MRMGRETGVSRKLRRVASATLALSALALLAATLTTARAEDHSFRIVVQKKVVDLGSDLKYAAWTYGGSVPGPILRVRQGERVSVDLANGTGMAHGIDIHAARIAPMHFMAPADLKQDLRYDFVANDPGVFAYHCSATPIVNHIANGMYGMMIVDPKGGWPHGKAHEVTLIQGEIYGDPDAQGVISGDSKRMMSEQPDFIIFNGGIEKYVDHPIEIKVGELVRIFFVNAGPNRVSTFHVMGTIFDTVYRSGNPDNAVHGVQSFEVGPADGAVFEFKVNEPGDYGFVDHAIARVYKGGLGVFHAVKPDRYQASSSDAYAPGGG